MATPINPRLALAITTTGDTAVLTFQGEMDAVSVGDAGIQGTVVSILTTRPPAVLLDVSGVRLMDSTPDWR